MFYKHLLVFMITVFCLSSEDHTVIPHWIIDYHNMTAVCNYFSEITILCVTDISHGKQDCPTCDVGRVLSK